MLLDKLRDRGQLYWRTEVGNLEPCYDSYIAPSFCWASVPSATTKHTATWGRPAVQWVSGDTAEAERYLSRRLCEILKAGTTPVLTGDFLGPVLDGFLVIRAPLIPCTIASLGMKGPTVSSHSDPAFEVDPFYCRFDCTVVRVELPDGRASVQRSRGAQPFEATEAQIALLRTVTPKKDISSPTVGVEGLILGRCPGRGGCQRLGYIQITPPGEIDAIDWSKWISEVTVY